MFLTIVTKKDLKYYYININNMFIKAILIKDIYLILLKDINITIKKILKINKSFYKFK